MTKREPVADGLFTWPSEDPQLIASERDGVISFPAQPGAPQRLLGRRGTLWSFTTQQFRPPSPPYDGDDTAATFVPYAIGYVELPNELLVQGRLTESDPAKLTIGQEMELRIVPYTVRDDGTEVLTYAFAPVATDEETTR
ncbi:OB-fold domain-containing protein [Nocardia sp. BSTN01]|uniref:Zn-ribbon domain-containing OB-fold protein n=1 Tax=Nocardia sp. BSTN01 TaxID=2783665 RepID=UPI00188EFCF4|nr:OB-fold domain-containing protein [Nocardia sp. BSTN01]MBF4997331.1 OB-fold domain-containing protein [Nocardia sp. BSTN01]